MLVKYYRKGVQKQLKKEASVAFLRHQRNADGLITKNHSMNSNIALIGESIGRYSLLSDNDAPGYR